MTPEYATPEPDPKEGRELEQIAAFLRRVLHAWPLALLCLSISALVGCAFLYFRNPGYRSETVILYAQGVRQPGEDGDSAPRNATVRLKELLMSRPKLGRVVSEFGLYPELRKRAGVADAVDELKRHVEFRTPGGDTFSIAFEGSSPAEAQRVTQALGRLVVEGDAELRKTQAELSRDFLRNEKVNRGTELKDAEQRLATFMGEHRRFALDTTPLSAGAAIRASVSPTPTAARPVPVRWVTPSRPASARAATTSTPSTTAATPAPGPDDAGERARASAALAAARANLNEQLARFTPAHPDVRAAQGAVERATARLTALGPEPKPVAVAAPAPAPAAPPPRLARTRGAPTPTVGPSATTEDDVVGLETEWLKLTRDVTAARQRQDQVEAALFKADTLASSEHAGRSVQVTVIDPAYLPERPVGFSVNVIAGLFLAAGALVGLLAAALNAALDDRIYRASDAPGTTTILVQVPRLHLRRRSHAA